MTPATERNAYVLGTHDAELARLGFQHRVWSSEINALWQEAGFAPGQTILDLGCGPGFATLDLAELLGPSGRVIAVDLSERFIRHLQEQARRRGLDNIEARVQDVHALDLPPASLDGAYARWVFWCVKDPDRVIARIARSLKPGGVLAIQDHFNQQATSIGPKHPALDRVFHAIGESWRRSGGDPTIAGRLPGMLVRHGLRLKEIKPHVKLGHPGSPIWEWNVRSIHNWVPGLVEAGLLTPEGRAEYDRIFAERSQDPSSFLCSPMLVDVVAVKP